MGTLLTLAAKDLRLLFRDRFALFWVFAFPLMYAGFFGMLFGGDGGEGSHGDLAIAVVDEEGSEDSARLVARLADHESLRVEREDEQEGAAPVLADLEQARAAVRKGRQVAYVRIPAGYGASPFAMFGAEDGAAPSLEVGIDPRRSAEAGFLQGILMEVVFGDLGDRFLDKEAMGEQVDRALEEVELDEELGGGQKLVLQTFLSALGAFVEDADLEVLQEGPGAGFGGGGFVEVVDVARERDAGPRSAFEITLPSAMIWGLMSVAMGFAITIVRERVHGTLLRLKIAPIGRTQLLAGKGLACLASCMIVMAFLGGIGVLALGVRVANVPLLILAMVCTAVCFTGLMMVCATLGRTEESVAGATWGLMMPFAMVGGGMIPLIAMPPWLLTLSNVSPFKWGILAVEGAVWRGFSAADMVLPCAILLAIGATFFALGAFLFRRIGLGK